MKLSKLLELSPHQLETGTISYAPSLSIFGDSYLLKHNPIYKNIRTQTLAIGFTYSDQQNSSYAAFPMSQLDQIIQSKIIPYTDNLTPLKQLPETVLQHLEWHHLINTLKPNYIFHESCHCLAKNLSSHIFKSDNLQEKVIVMLLEESFANTCEYLAVAYAQELPHRLFLEMNSFFTLFEERTLLKKEIEKQGLTQIFTLLMLAYLHGHFLNEDFQDNHFQL